MNNVKKLNEMLEAYSLFCGFLPCDMEKLINKCNRYNIEFSDLLEKAKNELKDNHLQELLSYIHKYAIDKLNNEFTKNVSLNPKELPNSMDAWANGKTKVSSVVLEYLFSFFALNKAYMNIIKDLITD